MKCVSSFLTQRKGRATKIVLLIFVITFSYEVSFCHDPLQPDTLRFLIPKTYVYGPPFSGKIQIELYLWNDYSVSGCEIPIVWNGAVEIDSVSFIGSRLERALPGKIDTIYNQTKQLAIDIGLELQADSILLPGSGTIVYLWGTASDTGFFTMEIPSFFVSPDNIFFTLCFEHDFSQLCYKPVVSKLEYSIHSSSIQPGDLDQNGKIETSDIVVLINYFFKSGYLNFFPSADVNSDCVISPSDIVYLINFIFKSGKNPIPGCAWGS